MANCSAMLVSTGASCRPLAVTSASMLRGSEDQLVRSERQRAFSIARPPPSSRGRSLAGLLGHNGTESIPPCRKLPICGASSAQRSHKNGPPEHSVLQSRRTSRDAARSVWRYLPQEPRLRRASPARGVLLTTARQLPSSCAPFAQRNPTGRNFWEVEEGGKSC